ncbi:hypothetical protein [Paraburkholderia metrosideri]|uniref:Alpha/beta hydrolase n=1 Tax=Paraburkholderia metrosideri TaxID=580937 RepID=A0ABM8NBX6_9BURK|nr:hypothetical protein [Paraburkholderia metrosideri]CAD6516303.1 hypothetical protein LMG28140_00754 [Paraburkholderia metrosideri]
MNRRDVLRGFSLYAATKYSPARAFSSEIDSPNHLLFIHGRGQQGRTAMQIKNEWLTALNRGAKALGKNLPKGIDVTFPYYGDILYDLASGADVPLTSQLQPRGEQTSGDFLEFQIEFADAIRRKAKITDAQIDAEYRGRPEHRGLQNDEWVLAMLRAIDKNVPGCSQLYLERFMRDVFLYVTRPGVRDAVDKTVRAALSSQPTVIVSHSLGTVVAYSVLSTDQRTLSVPLLVTLGSPLAVRPVRDLFRPIAFPDPVETWYNAFDPHDAVAMYPLNPENFPVGRVIENNAQVQNHTDNHHGISGYLDDDAVVGHILNALGRA